MHTLPEPFDMHVEVCGVDMTATVRVMAYHPERLPTFYAPGNSSTLEFSVERLTVHGQAATVGYELDALLSYSSEIRAECLERIEEANQPPEIE